MQLAPQAPVYPVPGPKVGISVAVLVTGLVIAGVAGFLWIKPLLSTLLEDPIRTPVNTTMHFDEGEYSVYEYVDGTRDVRPDNVVITGPGGDRIWAYEDDFGTTEDITQGSREYSAVVDFDIESAGDYQVAINTDGTNEVIVGRSFTGAIESTMQWFFVAGLGGLVAIAGLVMLIVAARRRGRMRRAAYMYGPPPGWAPPPTF
ncbi:MAG: hypothetical protein SGJ13_10470 [Actinomycetota bacterium]|nr:hypothetical protein [Actinomycetota bacterium]